MSLKKNVVANYLGQGFRVLMGLVFIPVYIRYLGIEAYGLIGIFALLQAWLGLLDMGMKPALAREMARFTSGAHDAKFIRDLLRSIEIVGIAIGIAIALGIWAASGWIASNWVTAENLPGEVVTRSFAVMGAVIGLRFIENIYLSSIVGLQRQVLENAMSSIMAGIRGFGAVGVLAWVSPTIEAFFVWQGLISLMTVAAFAGAVYLVLPKSSQQVRFSPSALLGIWRFAAGMLGITFLALLLTQMDKILLLRLLSLKAFGYYALAGVVANALYMLAAPITTAFYPRFIELVTRGDEVALRAAYHQAAQIMTVLTGTAAIELMVFGDRILMLWTADQALTQEVRPLMTVLVLGAFFHTLVTVPYHMQLANGWTALTIKVNIVAIVVLGPAILWVVPKHGAIGAAWILVTLNTGYLLFYISFMHQRLLPADKWRWYSQDISIPLAAALLTAGFCRWAIPDYPGRIGGFSVVLISSNCVLIAAVLSAPIVRNQLAQQLRYKFRYIVGKYSWSTEDWKH